MLAGLNLQTVAFLMAAGVLLDLVFGEVRRWHPLVGFGHLASRLERRFNRRHAALGAAAWMLAVVPVTALAGVGLGVFSAGSVPGAVLHVALLYFSLGLRSLHDHTRPIQRALERGDIIDARLLTARIVSRDTVDADPAELAKAAVESTLENGNDAVFGTLFWFVVAGGAGALLFRLANTLDAMWGYRTSRYAAFGWSAARIDDVLNWIPARLTAVSYALLGDVRSAFYCWRTQAPAWSSPNAGPVMAAGAGALGLALGGKAIYDGVVEQRPPLGCGRAVRAGDIGRAWRLVAKAVLLWIAAIAAVAIFFLKG